MTVGSGFSNPIIGGAGALIREQIQSPDYDGSTTDPLTTPGNTGWLLARSGVIVVNSGAFRGALYAATGTFAGSLSAATGTFAGSLSAATGTFGGTVTAGAVIAASISADNITAGTIIGSTFLTASSGTRAELSNDPAEAGRVLKFWKGTTIFYAYFGWDSVSSVLRLSGGNDPIWLASSSVWSSAFSVSVAGGITLNAATSGNVYIRAAASGSADQLYVAGDGVAAGTSWANQTLVLDSNNGSSGSAVPGMAFRSSQVNVACILRLSNSSADRLVCRNSNDSGYGTLDAIMINRSSGALKTEASPFDGPGRRVLHSIKPHSYLIGGVRTVGFVAEHFAEQVPEAVVWSRPEAGETYPADALLPPPPSDTEAPAAFVAEAPAAVLWAIVARLDREYQRRLDRLEQLLPRARDRGPDADDYTPPPRRPNRDAGAIAAPPEPPTPRERPHRERRQDHNPPPADVQL